MAVVAPARQFKVPNYSSHRPHRANMRQLSVSSSNALDNFGSLEDVIRDKTVVILLDYDGTLTPIVNDPSQALLPSRTRDILVELAERCVVGIVSGRSLPKVQHFVQVPSLFYAGSHGFDIWGPNTESMRYQVAADQLPMLASIRDRLTEGLKSIHGASVEDNVFSVTIHYRNCDSNDVQKVYEVVQTVKEDYPSIRFGTGKCVFELRPDITWDKGKAMVWLLQALGLREKDDVFTIYIGDDMTDEDAFQVFWEEKEDMGGLMQGCGIVVTDENKVTGANYSLRNPDEVAAFLSRVVEARGVGREDEQKNRKMNATQRDHPRSRAGIDVDSKAPAYIGSITKCAKSTAVSTHTHSSDSSSLSSASPSSPTSSSSSREFV